MTDFPPELRRVVGRWGMAVVYAVGMRLLGYPPTWADAGDAARVRAELNTRG